MATLKSIIAGIAIALSAALLNPLYADEPQPPKQRSNVEINQMKGENPVERSLPYFVMNYMIGIFVLLLMINRHLQQR